MTDDKIEELYARLCHLMEVERLFTESQLTRDKMAEHLGTNRTYLTRVIKEKTGMNYLQFINSYRINEAIRILSDPDSLSYPLKQIWSDLGFSSPLDLLQTLPAGRRHHSLHLSQAVHRGQRGPRRGRG